MATEHLDYQPLGLYLPILKMIQQQGGNSSALSGFSSSPEEKNDKDIAKKEHTHFLSSLDQYIQYPIKLIRDEYDDITEVWMSGGNLKFKILKDSFDDIIGYDVVIMDSETFKARIIFTLYNPVTDPPTEEKGDIEEIILIS